MLPGIWKSTVLFAGSQTSPSRASAKSSTRMNFIMDHWENDTERGNRIED